MFANNIKFISFSSILSKNLCCSFIKSNSLKLTQCQYISSRSLALESISSNQKKPPFRDVKRWNSYRFISTRKQTEEKSPLTWKNFFITFSIGGCFIAYIMYLKRKKMEIREKERTRSLGKSKLGGKFELVDQDNKVVRSDDFLGEWLLIYFGFTHCPDICPDEIEKMVKVVDAIDQDDSMKKVKPIFITVDPERDTPSTVKKYIREFSEKLIGLTGTSEQVAKACKAYRVYFSAGPKDSDSDYIVDHTIIMYLIDPDGNFVDYYGQNKGVASIVNSISFNMFKYYQLKDKSIGEKIIETIFG